MRLWCINPAFTAYFVSILSDSRCNGKKVWTQHSIARQNVDTSIICVSLYDRIYLICTCWMIGDVYHCVQVCFFSLNCFRIETGTTLDQKHPSSTSNRMSLLLCLHIYRSKRISNVCLCQPSNVFFLHLNEKTTTRIWREKTYRESLMFPFNS